MVLFLSGYQGFDFLNHFDPLLPRFSRLRVVDLSFCLGVQDGTLIGIGSHLHATLEVLYLKGLSEVTDAGIIAVAEGCRSLVVLEVSHVKVRGGRVRAAYTRTHATHPTFPSSDDSHHR